MWNIIGLGGMDWIGLAQDRYRWRGLVKVVMNLRFHKMTGNYRVATQLVASRIALISTEFNIKASRLLNVNNITRQPFELVIS
jgi:hypothetical protein